MATQDLYDKACQAVERANYDYAVALLRQVLREDPQFQDARRVLRATERRRLEEAGRSPLGLLTLPFRILVTAVRGLLKKGTARLEIYEDFLEKRPNSVWALMAAAGAAEGAGLAEEAIDIYRDALKLKPENKKAMRALADLFQESGDAAEALKYLSRLAALEPEDRELQREVRNLEATGHMAQHKMEQAGSFRDMIRDKELAAEFEEERSEAHTMDGLSRRISRLEDELQGQPEHVNRILRLAQLYEDSARLDDALKLLEEKHELLPDNYEIRETLGDVQLGAYDKAIAAVEKALAAEPEDAELRARREKLARQRSSYGVQEYEWRLAQHPTDRAIQLQLGNFYFLVGQYNDAIAAFQAVTSDARFGERATKMLGRCFMAKGQHDLALEQFERAISEHPQMDDEGKELHYYRAQALEAMGNREEALKTYKRIYSQDINFRDVAGKVEALSG
ncbi:MAG: tetratricopeptide repeat protein [Candidatus Brocadiaceae bacterium]|jgi:tetratricopeptide (TPR) repeat protein